jgi:hypothetical protein
MSNTWYVSQQHGSDTYDGTVPAFTSGSHGPKLTLAGLQTVMTGAGDTGYVGPGTYRERYTFQAGTQSLIGDPLAIKLTGNTPGQVRITGAAVTTELPSAGSIIQSGAFAGNSVKGYSPQYLLYVDGASTLECIQGASTANAITCQYVSSQGANLGFVSCICSNCIAISANTGYVSCVSNNCISIGATFGYSGSGTTAINCMAIGGQVGFSGGTTGNIYTNCLSFCSTTGFSGCASGGTTYMILTDCFAYSCTQAFNCNNATYPLVLSNGCYYFLGTATVGTVSGVPTGAGAWLLDASMLMKTFEPLLCVGGFGLGTATGAPATDILGRAMKSPPDIGPYEETASSRVPNKSFGGWESM